MHAVSESSQAAAQHTPDLSTGAAARRRARGPGARGPAHGEVGG
ncbi:MAG TPA: hypothetical protein VMU94_12980 [Streptosporangiaceae bacterium]|nr:hypothetical protein [Streptosporangiaceae bacterium]